ncbi:hypothetical protein [Streptomyces sp. NPDC052036]|uniref:hypothetical protein n=1 Tax=unclassified Streptomyces TaxID=2593676 RepID=UPI0034427A38
MSDRQPALDLGDADDEGPLAICDGATAVRGVAALVGEVVGTDGEGDRPASAEPLDEQPVSRVTPAAATATTAVALRRVAL